MLHRMLMGPVVDKSGGTNKRNEQNDDDNSGDDDALNEKISRMVNGAVNGLTKKGHFKEMIANSVKDTVGPMFEELKGAFSNRNSDETNDEKSDKTSGKRADKDNAVPPEMQRRLDELERANKRLTDEYNKEKENANAAKKRNDEQEERSRLTVALKTAGVSEDRLPGALALLYLDQKKIKRDKDNKIKFVVEKDGYSDDVELDTGVEQWIKTAEGKSYLPPRNVEGAGTRGGVAPIRRGEEPNEAQLMNALGNAMMGKNIDIG